MYAEGQVVAQDYAQAVKWFRLAADQGYAPAQGALGVTYEYGKGVPQDYAQAVKWYRLAADQGSARAQNDLVRLQAEQGNADAQRILGVTHADGGGAPPTASTPPSVDIAKLQRDLAQLGFSLGVPDGKLGPKTVQAIQNYQRLRGLPVTGKADEATAAQLSIDANAPTQTASTTIQQPVQQPVQQGDGTPGDQTCQSYGYRPSQVGYNDCRLQLDLARQQAEREQARYDSEAQLYREQIALYQAQQEAVKKEKERQKWAAMARYGFGMAASNSPTLAGGMADGAAAMYGRPPVSSPPVQPKPPAFENYTLRTPSGGYVYCSYSTATRYMECR
jgi:hypothetical protein